MPRVLIVSSFVAASRVGGQAQTLALAALGVDAVLAPTVLFGRHPGLGAPGGGVVAPQTFASLLAGAEAAGALEAEALLAGYFASPDQVEATAGAILRARAGGRRLLAFVDPIIGDEDVGAYVRPEVERAIADRLAPLADVLAPNLFELARLAGRPAHDASSALAAARTLRRPALISSIPCGPGRIGVLYVDGPSAWLASHAKAPSAPRGTGDLLAAVFLAALLEGAPPPTRLERAVGVVADAVEAALAAGRDDVSIGTLGPRWGGPTSRIVLESLS